MTDANPPGRPQKYDAGPVQQIIFYGPPGLKEKIARAAVRKGTNNSDWLVETIQDALKSQS